MLQEIDRHSKEMDAVSPSGKMAGLHVPVYLLHGSGDTIIPASESLWLARDVPHDDLRAVLISPALVHVDMDKKVTFSMNGLWWILWPRCWTQQTTCGDQPRMNANQAPEKIAEDAGDASALLAEI